MGEEGSSSAGSRGGTQDDGDDGDGEGEGDGDGDGEGEGEDDEKKKGRQMFIYEMCTSSTSYFVLTLK